MISWHSFLFIFPKRKEINISIPNWKQHIRILIFICALFWVCYFDKILNINGGTGGRRWGCKDRLCIGNLKIGAETYCWVTPHTSQENCCCVFRRGWVRYNTRKYEILSPGTPNQRKLSKLEIVTLDLEGWQIPFLFLCRQYWL